MMVWRVLHTLKSNEIVAEIGNKLPGYPWTNSVLGNEQDRGNEPLLWQGIVK